MSDEVALEWAFLHALQLSSVSIIPPMLSTHLYLIRRTSRPSMGAFKQNNALSDIGDHCTEERFHTAFFLSDLKG